MGRISRDKSRVKRYTHRMGTSVLTALVSTAPYAILPLVYVLLPGRVLPRKTTFYSLSPSDDAIDLDFGKRFSGTFGLGYPQVQLSIEDAFKALVNRTKYCPLFDLLCLSEQTTCRDVSKQTKVKDWTLRLELCHLCHTSRMAVRSRLPETATLHSIKRIVNPSLLKRGARRR